MVFLEDVVEPLFKLTRLLYGGQTATNKDKPTKEDTEKWFDLAKRASLVVRKRLFVVMQAHSQGWGFAKTLNFYQEGTNTFKSVHFPIVIYVFFIWAGGEADKHWLKAMKKHNKMHEGNSAPYARRGRGGYRGRGYQGRGVYHGAPSYHATGTQPNLSNVW